MKDSRVSGRILPRRVLTRALPDRGSGPGCDLSSGVEVALNAAMSDASGSSESFNIAWLEAAVSNVDNRLTDDVALLVARCRTSL